jgi:hypothetical protein
MFLMERWIILLLLLLLLLGSRGSSVSIMSVYGLDDRAIGIRSPAGAKEFSSSLCVQTGSGARPASCTMGTGGPFPGAKRGRGVTLTTHPDLVPRSGMSRSYISSPQSASMACSGTALLFALLYYYYHHHHHHFLSQVFFLPWYFSPWASGEPHHSGFKCQLVALSLWCVMFLVWRFL